MPTLQEALTYLGYDVLDDDVINANVTRCLATAERILQGAVGKDVGTYLPEDPRVKELALIYVDDLHSQRGLSNKVSGATRRLVHDMVEQLQLELRKAKREASA